MNVLLKTLIFDGDISVSVLDTTDMVNQAIRIHKTSPVCSAALGRTLTACTFMASGLKNATDKLSVTIAGGGPCGKITVSGNSNLEMRGSIDNPNVQLPLKENGKLDVGGAVGKDGRLTVLKSMGLKEPYSGSAKLVSGEIAEDFTAYYFYSEQQPTAMALGVKIGKDLTCVGAGGVVIQALPGAKESSIIKAEEIINKLGAISTLIEEKGAEFVLKEYFNPVEYQTYYPEYKCLCSREYIEKVLISLGKEELKSIVLEQGKINVKCEFCDKEYDFYDQDVEKLF